MSLLCLGYHRLTIWPHLTKLTVGCELVFDTTETKAVSPSLIIKWMKKQHKTEFAQN